MEYRNELKYICSDQDLAIFHQRILPFMEMDTNQNGEEFYHIRSLYFDTYDNRCVMENEAGVDDRKKIRIRIYNNADVLIRLEIKYKLHGMTRKESCPLTREQFDAILEDQMEEEFWLNQAPPLRMLYIARMTEYMKPKVIVEYDRTAFVCMAGNVRITFDRNIASSDQLEKFFEDDLPAIPVLEPGMHLLEVKFDEFLPEYIADALGTGNIRQTAFSKYYLSRKAQKYIC